jgi:hypothetical protein
MFKTFVSLLSGHASYNSGAFALFCIIIWTEAVYNHLSVAGARLIALNKICTCRAVNIARCDGAFTVIIDSKRLTQWSREIFRNP